MKPRVFNEIIGDKASLLIEEMGGESSLAALLHCKTPSIYAWRKKGVPQARLMFLQAMFPNAKVWQMLKEQLWISHTTELLQLSLV